MRKYFQLQFKMFNRHLIDFGITPILAYPILILAFIFSASALFNQTKYAPYLLSMLGVFYVLKLSSKKRNDFLQRSFSTKDYHQVRIAENVLISLPFVMFLIYKKLFLVAAALGIVAVVFSFIKLKAGTSFAIPTLFKKHPYEFPEGFRKTWYAFPIVAFLNCKAIEVNNFNLGVFSIVLIFLVCISYYTKTESGYFVWMFKKSPSGFLRYKIKIAVIYASLSVVPFLIILGIFFRDYIHFLGFLYVAGCAYLAQMIVAKYAEFPRPMQLPTSIILFLSIIFPPNILFTFPYFYKKAIQKLSIVLDD